MASGMGEAFYTVYTSSKEILKTLNQRHLFCNTLDLLTSTCKTTGMTCYLISNDDLVKFWLGEVLPLVFDKDHSIQSSAVAALEQALVGLSISDIHNSSHWPEFKANIVSTYPSRINELRESKNSNWHKIWCLLICILDQEIVRGAAIINAFLLIVELGFRNLDNTVRAEAFLCWRLLIKIFCAYNELSSPKRLKLICIPLKSSQPKTAHAATIKFRTWWYLLTCLGDRLVQNFDNVVEPFLTFAFGINCRGSTRGIAQQYRQVFTLALPSLVTLLSVTQNEQQQRIMREHQLETFSSKSPLMEHDVLKRNWRPLLNAAMETISLVNKYENDGNTSETEQHLQHMLLRSLTQVMITKNIAPFTVQMCTDLEKFIPEQPRPVLTVFNTIATDNLSLQRDVEDVEHYKSVLNAFMNLAIKSKSIVPPSILERCITLVYAKESLHAETQGDFRLLTSLLEFVLQSNDDDDYDAFEVKLMIWRQLSQAIINYLRANSLEYRLKQNSQLLDRWLLWPLQTCAGFAGRRSSVIFDGTFCEYWRQLLNAGHNSLERKKFLIDIKSALEELIKSRKEESQFAEIFDAYVGAVQKLGISKDSPLQTVVFGLMLDLLNNQTLPQKTIEGCLNSLRNVIVSLKNNEITIIFESLKPVLSSAVQTWKKQKYEGAFMDEWKRSIQDKMRTHPTKSYVNQIKDLFKGNDVFVIIPTVWSLNPEKLTDRQKERFAEKADIPALYNDMSQSQEASIKPWTPKKIVIAKNKGGTEIAIEGNNECIETITIEETPTEMEIHTPGKSTTNSNSMDKRTPNTRKSAANNKSSSSAKASAEAKSNTPQLSTNEVSAVNEKYNFRKIRLTIDEDAQQTPILQKQQLDENSPGGRVTRLRNAKKDPNDQLTNDKKQSPSVQQSPIKQRPQTPNTKSPLQKSKSVEEVIQQKQSAESEKKESTTVTGSMDIFTFNGHTPSLAIELNNANSIAEQETELATQIEVIAETQSGILLPDPVPVEAIKETEQQTISEAALQVQVQETSPRRPTTRFTGLSSPPDRKLTNNSTSPTLRPKPIGNLFGRGAQLINMIRNKKLDSSSTSPSPYTLSASSSSLSKTQQDTPMRNVHRATNEISTPTAMEAMDFNGTMDHQTSTPLQPKGLLTFTKRLPSPTASPSASILKRKIRCESIDEYIDSPSYKRKRVSFHDPPVSVTKEYVKYVDENKMKPKRCLVLDKVNNNTPENKHTLKRRSRLDSMIEIEKFASSDQTPNKSPFGEENTSANKTTNNETTTANETSESVNFLNLKWNDTTGNTSTLSSTSPVIATHTSESECQQEHINMMDIDSALDMVVDQCSLETILDKYFAKKTNATNANSSLLKESKILSNYMSNQMSMNPKIKSNVLETLSENHSKDFLDHAVQENLSSVVCDRLNLNSVLEYICSKSKINANCRNNLLAEIPEILRSIRVDSDRMSLIEKMLRTSNLSDANILEIITMLMRVRDQSEFNTDEIVSESAVDSSSNL